LEIIISEQAGVRSLHFASTWVQGAMRVARPYNLELHYTREMMAALLFRNWISGPKRVLVIGLGAGSLVKFLYRHFLQADITVVEINPSVHVAAQVHFRFPPETDRMRVIYADGADFIEQASNRYDLILLDGFDQNARMGRLNTPEFFLACAARLSRHGLMVINLLSKRKEFKPGLRHIQQAFGDELLALASMDAGNVVAFAGHTGVREITDMTTFESGAEALKMATGLNLQPYLKKWEAQGPLQLD
jgi:spermidine synthase